MPHLDRAEVQSLPPDAPDVAVYRPRNVIVALWAGGSSVADVPVDGTLTIGRERGSSGLLVQDRSVSREHARIAVLDGDIWLVDLGSVNGTRVGGMRIMPGMRVKVEPGVFIDVGAAAVVVQPSWLGPMPHDPDTIQDPPASGICQRMAEDSE